MLDFEEAMLKVAALTGASEDEIAALTAKAKEMGEKTKFRPTKFAEAFQCMAMAGWKIEDMLNRIESITNLAEDSGTDIDTIFNIVFVDLPTAMSFTVDNAGRLADVFDSIKKMIVFLYRKWIKGICRHLCIFCKFRRTEFDNCFWELTRKESDDES